MRGIEGKVAIVTGASRGIGAAISRRLVADGAKVVVHYRSGEERAGKLVGQLNRDRGVAMAFQADITKEQEVGRLFDEADKLGGPDILVNSAGAVGFLPLSEVTEEAFDEMFAVNAKGPMFTMREAASRMKDGGRIVNISTLGTNHAIPGQSLYGASKAAVEQFTLVGALELAPRGITVNAVSPGATDTEFWRENAPAGHRKQAATFSPFNRMGQPEDIADVVAFLVSEDARWITGQNIRASGGAA